jgi:hypothetical protein
MGHESFAYLSHRGIGRFGIGWGDFFERSSDPVSVIECFESDGGVNYRIDWLIWF